LSGSWRTFERSITIQDVPVAPSEHTETDVTSRSVSVGRIGVYLIAVLALLFVLWSMVEGGERDLWTFSSGLVRPAAALLLP